MTSDELEEQLRALRERLDHATRERWARSLPFGEHTSDRWARAASLGFGPGSSIYDSAYVYGDVTVGEQTWVGPMVLLDGTGGGISIGAYCSISAGVQVYTHDTVAWALTGGAAPASTGRVEIGDRCHVGAGAVIAPGVRIGTQCVVGAQAFVNRDVPDGAVVLGVPARIAGHTVVGADSADIRY